jgi:hypothetical protein
MFCWSKVSAWALAESQPSPNKQLAQKKNLIMVRHEDNFVVRIATKIPTNGLRRFLMGFAGSNSWKTRKQRIRAKTGDPRRSRKLRCAPWLAWNPFAGSSRQEMETHAPIIPTKTFLKEFV